MDGAAGRDSDTCLSIERMKKEEILACPPVLLSPAERERFFEEGFLCLEGFAHESVAAMLAAADRAVARSAPFSAPHSDFSFDADHHRDQPRPSRLFRACEEDPAFSSYAFQAPSLDLVADLVGPAVRYREAYINYKWSRGGTKVDWHQDLAFLLHTNRAIVSTVTYLVDVTPQMAPLMVIPHSHHHEVFDHYDAHGAFVARIDEEALARLPAEKVSLPGPAGTVIIFDGCLVHGSKANESEEPRPALVMGYSAADAFPFTQLPPQHRDRYMWSIVRGERPLYAHHEPMEIRMPPPRSTPADFEPIFDMQEKGERAKS